MYACSGCVSVSKRKKEEKEGHGWLFSVDEKRNFKLNEGIKTKQNNDNKECNQPLIMFQPGKK